MRTFKLTLAYDGAGFVGWQRQASGTSIQGLLEDALANLDRRPVAVAGAGRTDAGVHALGQVAACSLERDIEAPTLVRALNAVLPDTVRVLAAAQVPPQFHPRFDARAKTYHYRIWNAEVLSPFERAHAWHIPAPPLDLAAMAAAAARLKGRHDFSAFQGTGSEAHTTERLVFSSRVRSAAALDYRVGGSEGIQWGADRSGSADLEGRREPLILYQIRGEGFLRHMVRNIVGTLVEIGRGRCPVEWVDQVLAARDRTRAGRTAPPEGLFLVRVDYDAQL